MRREAFALSRIADSSRSLPWMIDELARTFRHTTDVNRMNRIVASALTFVLALCACTEESAWRGPVAATLGTQKVLDYKAYRALPEFAEANLSYGERISQQCQKCHTLDARGAHKDGPNLSGFLGRPVAARERFAYSRAMRDSEFTWTPRALDAWLAAPEAFLPGNDMQFDGVANPAARRALIAYLLQATDPQASGAE